MSDANIQLVKQGFDRFGAGDIAGFLELMSADVHWDHRGPAVRRVFRLPRHKLPSETKLLLVFYENHPPHYQHDVSSMANGHY